VLEVLAEKGLLQEVVTALKGLDSESVEIPIQLFKEVHKYKPETPPGKDEFLETVEQRSKYDNLISLVTSLGSEGC